MSAICNHVFAGDIVCSCCVFFLYCLLLQISFRKPLGKLLIVTKVRGNGRDVCMCVCVCAGTYVCVYAHS